MTKLRIENDEFGFYEEEPINVSDGMVQLIEKFTDSLAQANAEIADLEKSLNNEIAYINNRSTSNKNKDDSDYFKNLYESRLKECKKKRNSIKLSLILDKEVNGEFVGIEIYSMTYRKYISFKKMGINLV